jgi:hypothetical protein
LQEQLEVITNEKETKSHRKTAKQNIPKRIKKPQEVLNSLKTLYTNQVNGTSTESGPSCIVPNLASSSTSSSKKLISKSDQIVPQRKIEDDTTIKPKKERKPRPKKVRCEKLESPETKMSGKEQATAVQKELPKGVKHQKSTSAERAATNTRKPDCVNSPLKNDIPPLPTKEKTIASPPGDKIKSGGTKPRKKRGKKCLEPSLGGELTNNEVDTPQKGQEKKAKRQKDADGQSRMPTAESVLVDSMTETVRKPPKAKPKPKLSSDITIQSEELTQITDSTSTVEETVHAPSNDIMSEKDSIGLNCTVQAKPKRKKRKDAGIPRNKTTITPEAVISSTSESNVELATIPDAISIIRPDTSVDGSLANNNVTLHGSDEEKPKRKKRKDAGIPRKKRKVEAEWKEEVTIVDSSITQEKPNRKKRKDAGLPRKKRKLETDIGQMTVSHTLASLVASEVVTCMKGDDINQNRHILSN